MTTTDTLEPNATLPDRTPHRVRHPLRFRALQVRTVQRITPHLVRVTLGGDALEGCFKSSVIQQLPKASLTPHLAIRYAQKTT